MLVLLLEFLVVVIWVYVWLLLEILSLYVLLYDVFYSSEMLLIEVCVLRLSVRVCGFENVFD